MKALSLLLTALALAGCATAPRGIEGCLRLAAKAGHDLSGQPMQVYRIPHTNAAIVDWLPLVGGPQGGSCTLVNDRVTELSVGEEQLIP